MKKTMILILGLILILAGCGGSVALEDKWINGEKLVFRVGTNKPYSGEYSITNYNSDGSEYISESGKYKKGKLDGKIKCYNSKNIMIAEINYKNGLRNGKVKTYYTNGNLSGECEYRNEKLNGTLIEYNEVGKKIKEIEYLDGEYNGIYKIWNNNGKIQKDLIYKNGKIVKGFLSEHSKNGERKEFYYEDGKLNGKYRDFTAQNDLGMEVTYKNGKLNGKCKAYYKKELRFECNYKDGILDGEFFEKNVKNGNYIKTNYKNGKIFGEYSLYTKENKVIFKVNLKNNEIQDGELIFPDSYYNFEMIKIYGKIKDNKFYGYNFYKDEQNIKIYFVEGIELLKSDIRKMECYGTPTCVQYETDLIYEGIRNMLNIHDKSYTQELIGVMKGETKEEFNKNKIKLYEKELYHELEKFLEERKY